MPSAWHRLKDHGRHLTLDLYIQPEVMRTEIAGPHGDALKIKGAAPPADHLVDDKLLEFLKKSFRVGKNQVVLKPAAHVWHKIVEIAHPQLAPDAFWISQ